MGNIHGKYLRILGLVIKLSFISLHLRQNSELPLLHYENLNVSNHSMPARIYQSSHQNTESNYEKKIKVFRRCFFSLQNF